MQIAQESQRHRERPEDGNNDAPSVPPRVQTLHFADVDELTALVPRANLRYTQLEPGAAPGRISRVQLADLSLLNIYMSNETLARAIGDGVHEYYVVIPVRWRGELSWSGRPIEQRSIMAWGHDPTYVRRGHDLEVFVLMHQQHEFLDAAAAWTGREPGPWQRQHGEPQALAGTASCLPDTLQSVLHLLKEHPGAFATQGVRQCLADALTGELLEAHESIGWRHAVPARSLVHRNRIVLRADQYLQQHLDGHVSKLDLCKSIGASARSIDLAFRDVCGMTMGQYLRAHRLRRARQLLRDGDPRCVSVKQCALDAGFLQFGRFAADYRRFFGEKPSETLSRYWRRAG